MGKWRTKQVAIAWGERKLPFVCFDSPASMGVLRAVLSGGCYRPVDCLGDVRLIVDIGANIGAASVYFHLHYPDARIVAVEPSAAAFALLLVNAASIPQIEPRQTALYDKQARMNLHAGRSDTATNSFGLSALNSDEGDVVDLEEASEFFRRENLQAADIVKIDTEGCEFPILNSLRLFLPRIRAIYIEYHSETDRRRIDALLEPTHLLYAGTATHPHRGEFCYLARDALPSAHKAARLEIRPPES